MNLKLNPSTALILVFSLLGACEPNTKLSQPESIPDQTSLVAPSRPSGPAAASAEIAPPAPAVERSTDAGHP